MARRAAKRRFSTFSLSFLDVMSCGFGAVVLVFLVINRIDDGKEADRELLSESRKLDYLIQIGEADLVDLQRQLEDQRRRVDEARDRLLAAVADRDRRRDELQELEARTNSARSDLMDLESEVAEREREVRRMQAQEEAARGQQIRAIAGEGDRQYLTGLFVGGSHILLALDVSASMLDRTIVQIVRRRNMPPERQLRAPKWLRAQRVLEWLAAQVPLDGNYQIALFNTSARLLLPGKWHRADDPDALDRALAELAALTPAGGTNLEALANALTDLSPRPDNVFLITDGLPTQSARAPRSATISGRDRLELFEDALDLFPKNMPVNTILLPLEGDPDAPSAYWDLAVETGGTFLAPSEDWP